MCSHSFVRFSIIVSAVTSCLQANYVAGRHICFSSELSSSPILYFWWDLFVLNISNLVCMLNLLVVCGFLTCDIHIHTICTTATSVFQGISVRLISFPFLGRIASLWQMAHVAWSLCMCLRHTGEPCKNGWSDRDAVRGWGWLSFVQGNILDGVRVGRIHWPWRGGDRMVMLPFVKILWTFVVSLVYHR